MTGSPIASELMAAACELSPPQARTWMLSRAHPFAYRSQCTILIEGPVTLDRLQSAIDQVVARHDMLRARVAQLTGGEPQQSATSPRPHPIDEHADLTHARRRPQASAECRAIAKRLRLRIFDEEAGLLHLALITERDDRRYLVCTAPAYVLDRASLHLWFRDLAAELTDRRPAFDDQLSYFAVAEWLRDLLSAGDREFGRAFWREARHDALPGGWRDVTAATRASFRPATEPILLRDRWPDGSPGAAAAMLAAWQVLLRRTVDPAIDVLGVVQDGRRPPDLQHTIGALARAVPLASPVDLDRPFSTIVAACESAADEARAWQEYYAPPDPERYLGYGFEYDADGLDAIDDGAVRLSLVDVWSGVDRFDLKLVAAQRDGALTAEIQYDKSRYSVADVEYLAERFRTLWADALEHPDRAAADLAVVGAVERRRLLEEWNDTAAPGGGEAVHHLIEKRAATTADAVAVIDDRGSLSYRALNRRANRLARCLMRLGVTTETRVGVCVNRSSDMVVALLGILKAGATFVPLDPGHPIERRTWMLRDAGVTVLLMQRGTIDASAAEHVPHTIALDELPATSEPFDDVNPAVAVHPDNLAYVMYTSGSTGTPKGAMNTHRGFANRLVWGQRQDPLRSDDRVLQKTSVGFDVSLWELFWPLTAGATLVLATPGGHRDPIYLADTIRRRQITTVHFVPSMLGPFLETPSVAQCSSLVRLLCSGEALTPELQRRTHSQLRAELHNLYGPTETSIEVTWWQCPRKRGGQAVPIGRPIANTVIHLVSAGGAPAPVGAAGELCIGGVAVGRGYLNRAGLTAERFVPNPWGGAGARMYRTGDRARWRSDGVVEYLGREDDQVKVGGCRIELREIEAVLEQAPSVREAVVLAQAQRAGAMQLVAYVVTAERGAELERALRAHATRLLPAYMVPHVFVALEQWPLTPNGKLDRAALSALPDARGAAGLGPAAAPRTRLEEQLCACWRDMLALERAVGIDEDFFTIGGHSLLAVQLAFRVRRDTGHELLVADLLEHATVRELAAFLEQRDDDEQQRIVVQMQEGAGAAAPLYVVHPIDGGVLCYGDLARALGDDKPLYALRAPSPESPLANGTTIETMAADYLRVVERHAGDRPYQVGGWSFGGLVALEMARRASAAGRSPDLVVLIDPTDAAHEVDPNWTDGDLAQMFLTGLVRLIGAADRPPLTGVPATIDFDAQLDHAVRLGCLAVDIDRDACRAAFLTYLRTNRATASYRPEPYAGAALLIQPRPDPERPRDDPWPALLPQAQRVVFDGNHFSLMRDANGDQLAALVRAHDSASKGAQ